jgi:DHA1 family inner membrane transport protein
MLIRTPARVPLALLALALGGFAIGASEFTGMGLLIEITQSLLRTEYGAAPTQALASAGWVITVYAAGVVIGAPSLAALTARVPAKRVLLGLLVMFILGSVASALSTSLPMLLIARFATGIPHGAYFGLAVLTAGRLLPARRRALGSATVIGGLTISNVIGVPAITWLGQNVGWQSAYLAIASLFAMALILVAVSLPRYAGDSAATIVNELRALRHVQVWLALAMGAIGFGGLFAVYAYIRPLSQHVTGLSPEMTPLLLAVIGIGMTAGNFIGGWAADRSVRRTTYTALVVLAVGLLGLVATAQWAVGLFLFSGIVGAGAAALGPTIQTRLMDVASEGQTLAAALNHSAFNIANALGSSLGGIAIATGLGFIAPIWIGLGLTAGGTLLALTTFGADRRHRRRGVHLPYGTGVIRTIGIA